MDKTILLKQLDKILADYDILKSRANHEDLSGNVSVNEITELVTKAKAAVVRMVGINSEYYKDIMDAMGKNVYVGVKLKRIVGSIKALRDDLNDKYLENLFQIIHGEIFSDYLEMAS